MNAEVIKLSHEVEVKFRPLKVATSNHAKGEVRKPVSVKFEYDSVGDDAVDFAVRYTMESYIRKLIADNSDDWDFIPKDYQLTLVEAKKYFEDSSRKEREITNAKLAAFAELYKKLAVEYSVANPAAASVGALCFEKKFVPILGNIPAMEKLFANLVAIGEKDEKFVEENESILSFFAGKIDEVKNATITIDSL